MSKTKLISFLDARKSPSRLRLRASGWARLLAQTRVEKQSREGGLDEVRAGGIRSGPEELLGELTKG